MDEFVVGVLAIGVGTAFCFRGYLAMRVVIPIWGALTGFFLGAGLVARFADEGLLATATGWLVGVAVGLVFALLAYLYYEISVMVAMGGIGFALGTGLMVALGVRWNWVIILVGLALAILLAFVALAADLPMLLLVVLSAMGGAVAMIAGAMLLGGVFEVDALGSGATTERIEDDWWWYVAYVLAVITGIVIQLRDLAELRGTLRDAWAADGGRSLR